MNGHVNQKHPIFASGQGLFLLLLIVGLVLYGNILKSEFIFDDFPGIVENPTLKSWAGLKELWLTHSTRFVPYASFALHFLSGFDSLLSFHLVNIVLHVTNSFLVYALSGILVRWVSGTDTDEQAAVKSFALFSALIFLVHPVQTQAVTYTIQRITELYALFYLMAVYFYVRGRLSHTRIDYGLSLASTVTAMFCKENAVTIPLMLLAIEFCAPDRKENRFAGVFPFFLCALIVPVFLSLNQEFRGIANIADESGEVTRGQYFLTQTHVFWDYLRLAVFPLYQNLDYDVPVVSRFPTIKSAIFLLIFIGSVVMAGRMRRRWGLISLAVFWFWITMSVESSLIPIRDSLVEHRLYLPMASIAWLIVIGISRLLHQSGIRVMMMLSVVTVLSFLTVTRNMVWRNNITMWTDVVKKSPGKVRGYIQLGNAYMRAGIMPLAGSQFDKAFKIEPRNVYLLNSFGIYKLLSGQKEEALKYFRQCLDIDPGFRPAANNLSKLLSLPADPG